MITKIIKILFLGVSLLSIIGCYEEKHNIEGLGMLFDGVAQRNGEPHYLVFYQDSTYVHTFINNGDDLSQTGTWNIGILNLSNSEENHNSPYEGVFFILVNLNALIINRKRKKNTNSTYYKKPYRVDTLLFDLLIWFLVVLILCFHSEVLFRIYLVLTPAICVFMTILDRRRIYNHKSIKNAIDSFLVYAFCCFIYLFLPAFFLSGRADAYATINGPSIIRKVQIESIGSFNKHHYATFSYIDKGITITKRIEPFPNTYKPKFLSYVYWNYEKNTKPRSYILYPNQQQLDTIGDVAFVWNKSYYSLLKYSLLNPDYIYENFGYNLVYKSSLYEVSKSDSTFIIYLKDVCGVDKCISYNRKHISSIPDTFLVYRNVNEKLDSVWHVCAPEVNTPENRAKISDYGYIFHYDVYSKEEIESQCPQIKNYVEQYKKRMAEK